MRGNRNTSDEASAPDSEPPSEGVSVATRATMTFADAADFGQVYLGLRRVVGFEDVGAVDREPRRSRVGTDGRGALEPIAMVATDRPDYRSAVQAELEGRGFTVCADAKTVAAVMATASTLQPDVVLLDTSLARALQATVEQIVAAAPSTEVILLGDGEATEQVLGCLRVGAAGFLPDDSDPSAVASAAAAAVSGEAALPRMLVRRVIAELHRQTLASTPATTGLQALTAREQEVLDLLSDGLSTAEIGERLYVSKVTVRTHVSSILRKLGVEDRRSAVRVAQGC